MDRTAAPVLAMLIAGTLMATPLHAADAPPAAVAPTYRTPPEPIKRILEAKPRPGISLSPKRDRMVLMDRIALPPISDIAQPMLRLAGSRVNPAANAPYGPRRLTGFTIKTLATGAEQRVDLSALNEAEPNLGSPNWSHDNERFTFTVTRATGVELWVCDAATATARSLSGPIVNTAAGGAVRWMPDGRTLLVKFVPAGRGKAPERPLAPTGPIVQETYGKTAQVRTLQDMLKDAHDETLFDYYMTAQLALVDAASGTRTDIGAPAVFSGSDPSPSGEFLLISRTHRPYSYAVGSSDFPETVEVWDRAGKLIHTLCDMPLREEIPIEGVQTGPRGHEWNDAAPATLLWAEALDGGDPKNKVPQRDKVMTVNAPFTGEPRELFRTEHRYMGLSWLEKAPGAAASGSVCMYNEYDRDKRWTKTWMLDTAAADGKPVKVFDRSVRDRYNNPGTPLAKENDAGRSVVRVHNNSLFLRGEGATPEGNLPFLDVMPMDTLKPARMWRCEKGCDESVVDLLADDASSIMTSWQTPDDPPNYFTRKIARAAAVAPDGAAFTASDRVAVTAFPHPAPELRGLKKELVKYKRADGVDLSATMYYPLGFDAEKVKRGEAKPLPLFIWAYPLEFNDAATAGQVSGSPWSFNIFGGLSHLFMVTQGYAVMDAATMPIVGDPETMNDTFVEQIVASAKAAIEKAAELGADPDRAAVGGHSYGAFMTANLLAHCDLFRAGVARSGAYNRTLTPFGFQGERRTYWQAEDTYTRLSPFTYADKIKAPVLMIHGQNDSNPGTFPVQSERLYAAIKGTGGTARFIMLPYEDHGYAAKESVFTVQAETVEWLDKWVKNAPSRTPVAPATSGEQAPAEQPKKPAEPGKAAAGSGR
ncbi:MAG: S9 family peptidase [Phycisphaerales bacterium]